jgi:FKBP-type peptidyl-prolyl cis-trans isomerase FklB
MNDINDKRKMDKISYALGLSIGNSFRASGVSGLKCEDFLKGIEDIMGGEKPAMGYDEAKRTVSDYFTKLQGEKDRLNRSAGEEFLTINKNKAGVVVLPSGLQYEVINKGYGRKPALGDRVRCHYHGVLVDGRVFDSSVERGEPAVFEVSQVIAGWTEALQLMAEGSKWRLTIPSSLAYGDRQAGEMIGPGSVLIFDVELLDIV